MTLNQCNNFLGNVLTLNGLSKRQWDFFHRRLVHPFHSTLGGRTHFMILPPKNKGLGLPKPSNVDGTHRHVQRYLQEKPHTFVDEIFPIVLP